MSAPWTDVNTKCKPEMDFFPPVGGAVDMRMCSTVAWRKEQLITEILRQRVRGLGGERDMEEQGRIQAREHPTTPVTLYIQLLLTPVSNALHMDT